MITNGIPVCKYTEVLLGNGHLIDTVVIRMQCDLLKDPLALPSLSIVHPTVRMTLD